MQTHPKARKHTIEVEGSGSPTHPWRVISPPSGPLPCPSWPSEGMILKDEQLDGFFVKALCPHCHYPAMLGAPESPVKAFRCRDQRFCCMDQRFCGRTWGFEEMKRHTRGWTFGDKPDLARLSFGMPGEPSLDDTPNCRCTPPHCLDCDKLHSSSRIESSTVEDDVAQLTERMGRKVASIVSDVDAGEYDVAAVQLSRLARTAVECAALVGKLRILEDVIDHTDG